MATAKTKGNCCFASDSSSKPSSQKLNFSGHNRSPQCSVEQSGLSSVEELGAKALACIPLSSPRVY